MGGSIRPHRLGYPVDLVSLPIHVEVESENSTGETWMVNAAGTATFNCVIEVRTNLGSSAELDVAFMPLGDPVTQLWLSVDTFDVNRRW